MTTIRTKLGKGGRVVIPAEFRKTLHLRPGDDLVMVLEDGAIKVFTIPQAIKEVQKMVRRFVPKGRSLADELIAERRAEAARE